MKQGSQKDVLGVEVALGPLFRMLFLVAYTRGRSLESEWAELQTIPPFLSVPRSKPCPTIEEKIEARVSTSQSKQ